MRPYPSLFINTFSSRAHPLQSFPPTHYFEEDVRIPQNLGGRSLYLCNVWLYDTQMNWHHPSVALQSRAHWIESCILWNFVTLKSNVHIDIGNLHVLIIFTFALLDLMVHNLYISEICVGTSFKRCPSRFSWLSVLCNNQLHSYRLTLWNLATASTPNMRLI